MRGWGLRIVNYDMVGMHLLMFLTEKLPKNSLGNKPHTGKNLTKKKPPPPNKKKKKRKMSLQEKKPTKKKTSGGK